MRPVRKTDNLNTFMCRLSFNLGTSTSCNPLGLSRPVMGLLYLYLYTTISRLRVAPLSASTSMGSVDSFHRNKTVVTWSHSTIASVKNAWSYTSISSHAFMSWHLKTQKTFYEYEKYGVFAVWLKPPEGEADHSHTYSTKVKNAWSFNSTSPCIFLAWCIMKHMIFSNRT